uniref:Cytochrome P450 n=1 Tax=Kalanchoe fedtschenkoi TaxID=63787 RepID=A0A7N0UHI8_KALFE
MWLMVTVTICICFLLRSFLSLFLSKSGGGDDGGLSLLPGPTSFRIITAFSWTRKSFSQIEAFMRTLRCKYGPIVALWVRFRVSIFVFSHKLAHKALVQNGAIFSNHPAPSLAAELINTNQKNISSAFYGPTWRLFRRNLTSEILHSSRVRSYSAAHKWVLDILIRSLEQDTVAAGMNTVDRFQYAMFCLLVFMCFGDRVHDEQIKQVERVQRDLVITLPEEKRCLTEEEMVTLCSEFLSAGTDTTSTALQWIMTNLVKHKCIQDTLDEEMKSRIGSLDVEIREKDLHKLPYLKAVILEGLRRHPPGHFVLPHAVSEDTEFYGHLIPKNGDTVNFMIAEMGFQWTAMDEVSLEEKQEFTIVMKHPLHARVELRK